MTARILALAFVMATALAAQQRPPFRVPDVGPFCVKCPAPVYPKIAREARVTGVVRLVVWIDAAGDVREIRLISGHPFLVRPAMDAVKQWHYAPRYWPSGVITTVEVGFRMDDSPPAEKGIRV